MRGDGPPLLPKSAGLRHVLEVGPIIEQDAARVSHGDSVEHLRRIGRDVERVALARAVREHLEDRIARGGERTVVF